MSARRHPETQSCEWFAMCQNTATGVQPHPILGDVPICDRCKEKYDTFSD